MTRPDEHDLPPQLQRDFHSLVPEVPSGLSAGERAFLNDALRSTGRPGRWYAAVAAAAGLLITVALLQVQWNESKPTIVDALRAAQSGESQLEVDALAMAAVRITRVEVSQ